MMKIFKSLAIITAVVAIAGGGTYALWTDSAVISGSTFATESFDLKIDSDITPNGYRWVDNFSVADVLGAAFKFDGLYPGYPADGEHNWQVIDILETNGEVPNSEVTMKLQRTTSWNALASNLKFKIYFDGNYDQNFDLIKEGTLDDLNGNVINLGKITSSYRDIGGKGKPASVRIEWSVPREAGNDIQNKEVTIDTTFGLTQE